MIVSFAECVIFPVETLNYLSVCCGHLFCKSCLGNVKKAAAISNACPICRDKEFVIRLLIEKLKVFNCAVLTK